MLDADSTARDFAGNQVPRTCENCEGLYDDSDGPEYGPPCMRCDIKPQMENLKGFPFSTPQKCFVIAWWHLVDWDAEGRKLDEEARQRSQSPRQASNSGAGGPVGRAPVG